MTWWPCFEFYTALKKFYGFTSLTIDAYLWSKVTPDVDTRSIESTCRREREKINAILIDQFIIIYYLVRIGIHPKIQSERQQNVPA